MSTDRFDALDQVLAARRVPTRSCQECSKFVAHPDGLACGWCEAHAMWVKLYHRPERWHTQCQFKTIRRERRTA